MPFTIIKGIFNPQSGIPDGDSVRFLANDDSLFDRLAGRVEFKSGGEVQLRYEGIDALEKAAIEPFSSDATKRNLELLGGAENGQPGYILANQIEQNGRPVCFVFTGNPDDADGSEIILEPETLQKSVNYQLLAAGFVYPLFYDTLYKELRDRLVAAVTTARQKELGIWTEDATNQGFTVKPPVNLAELEPIFPKLWRRLETFYRRPSNQDQTVKQFLESLAQGSDRLFTIPDQRSIKFSTALEVKGNKLKVQYKPEEMIFRS
ncbi:MAG: thermonuclease family protein [Waterburya sp.]